MTINERKIFDDWNKGYYIFSTIIFKNYALNFNLKNKYFFTNYERN